MSDLDTFGVYFNSGQNNRSNTYVEGANVTHIQINNSDQTYYQDGIIELYDCDTQNVGDDVDIFINGSLEFAGYVSRRQIHHKAGKKLYSYQLIGKTYDLWRYRTGKGKTYTGYSGYIASSLIHDYCTNIHGNSNITEGTLFENKIDLSDQTVGDALVTLIGYDGFKFYIDNDNNLVYYNPDDEDQQTKIITEDDIIDMSPIEEADEDLVNDVLVIGAENYYTTTEIPLPAGKAIANVSSGVFKTNMYLAQRVKANEDTMSAVRMFLNRSASPNEPVNNLEFEVWDNTTQQLMNDSFDGGMANWSVTSNTFFEDGYLRLSMSIGEEIKQTTYNTSSYNAYNAQTFKCNTTTDVDSAYIMVAHTNPTVQTLWVEIRNIKSATTGEPSGSNGILCSGSISQTNSIFCMNPINLNPSVTLVANKSYSVVSHFTDTSTIQRAQVNTASSYSDGSHYYGSNGESWTLNTNVDTYFKVRLRGYAKTGYALSKSFGSPARKVFDRYMKVELDGITSSQRIYISGSNSGSKHFHTLTDSQWFDFGSENIAGFSSQVKIWLSGNGTYTPKVGSCYVSVADTTAGPGGNIFTDGFSDYTYLSGASFHGNKYRNHTFVDTGLGLLMMSSAKGYTDATKWKSPTSVTDTKSYWTNESSMVDNNASTYGYATNAGGSYTLALVSVLDTYRDISKIKFMTHSNGDSNIFVTSLYASGNWAGVGYKKIVDTWQLITQDGADKTTEITFANSCKYYNVKRIAISGVYWVSNVYTPAYPTIKEIYVLQENNTLYSGSIWSKDYNIGNPIVSLKLSPTTETYPNRITYSGSKDSGSSWYKLTKNEFITLGAGGASGQHVRVMYNFKPSTQSQSNANPHISTQLLKNASPSIDSAVLEYASTTGIMGLPKSGTKLERSSDIYIQPSDVPYPPSYSAWVSYTHPALRQNDGTHLDTDNYYWIVMHSSGSTTSPQYWKYYHDINSDYTDGLIAGSMNNGATWTTWTNSGSLIMDIGWKGDEQIRATATNEQSINLYGRHQKIVTDTRVDSFALASSMANEMVAGSENIIKKGYLVIDGVEGMKTTWKISSNLEELGMGGLWEIVQFTQNVDNNGFTSKITYGAPEFSIARRIADIERKVGI